MNTSTIVGCDPEVVWVMQSSSKNGYNGMLPAGIVLNRLEKIGSPMVTGNYKGYPCIDTKHGRIFGDGAGWELNPHAGTVPEVVENLRGLMATSYEVAKVLSTTDRSIAIAVKSSMKFELEMLAIWGDEQLTQFGCDPDKSIWPREVNPSNVDATKHPYRYFGGHIHLGFPLDDPVEFYQDMDNLKRMIVLADATVGLAGLIYDCFIPLGGAARRRVYGQPGVYRPQPHGIEYRTASNSWLVTMKFAKEMLSLVSLLPELFTTTLPDFIMDDHSLELRKVLIHGSYRKGADLLDIFARHIEHEEFSMIVRRLYRRSRDRYYDYPMWEREWGVQ